tara:strand:+ start:19134 stop:19619 length:486 start_codon:yes stop_codon:yes gene_type:complete
MPKNEPKRKTKATLAWEERFMPLLLPIHKTHAKGTFHRLLKKTTALKSSLKKRSDDYGVVFDLTLDVIRELFVTEYGKPCKFCKTQLKISNMVCDHEVPISLGGDSTIENLQLICRRCNTRKGTLTSEEYFSVIRWLDNSNDNVNKYVYRKLSMSDITSRS